MVTQIDPFETLYTTQSGSLEPEIKIGDYLLTPAELTLPSGIVINGNPVSVHNMLLCFVHSTISVYRTIASAIEGLEILSIVNYKHVRNVIEKGTENGVTISHTTVPATEITFIFSVTTPAPVLPSDSLDLPRLVLFDRSTPNAGKANLSVAVRQLSNTQTSAASTSGSSGSGGSSGRGAGVAGLIYVGLDPTLPVNTTNAIPVLTAGVSSLPAGATRLPGGKFTYAARNHACNYELRDSPFTMSGQDWADVIAVVLDGSRTQIEQANCPYQLENIRSQALVIYFPQDGPVPEIVRETRAVVAPRNLAPAPAQAFFWEQLWLAASRWDESRRRRVFGV